MNDKKFIFKMLTETEWVKFQDARTFQGSNLDLKDGFIHACYEEQVLSILEKYFSEITPVYSLKIDVSKVSGKNIIKDEWNSDRTEQFPHIYGCIDFEAVVSYEIIN